MRDGSNVRQELAAVNYVSVWSVCVCVLCVVTELHDCMKEIYMYVYIYTDLYVRVCIY